MQDLNFHVEQQHLAFEIFDCIGRVSGALCAGGDLRSECDLYTRTLFTGVSWQAVCHWLLEEKFPGQPTLGDRLREGVELVRSGRASVEHVAQALLVLANH